MYHRKPTLSLLSMLILKSPKTMRFSYLDEYKAKPLCRISKWLLIALFIWVVGTI